MNKDLYNLLSNCEYDVSIVGLYTKMWITFGRYHVNSKKTRGGAYSVAEYEGIDEAEAVKAFEESEDKKHR